MRNSIIIFFIVLFIFINCGDEIKNQEIDDKSHCEIALDYISKCIGSKVPRLKSCDEGFAIEIVNTPCNELSKIIFDK